MYEDLTQREQDILLFIKRFSETKGYPPTVREIGKELDIKSTSTVHACLEKLESKNYLRKDSTKTRTLALVDPDDDIIFRKKKTVDIPIVGTVTAGLPIFAYENIEDTFPLPIETVRDRNLFILKVRGDSMINAGILDGDYVIIEKTEVARNGEMVLALIEDEATIKTFYKENGHYRLQPENDYYSPIIVNELLILGKIVGLFRNI